MENCRVSQLSFILLAATIWPIALTAANAQPTKAARAQASAPDLNGVWVRYPGGGPSKNFLTRGPEPPMTPWAEELFKPIKASYAAPDGYLKDPVFQCFPPGVPRI